MGYTLDPITGKVVVVGDSGSSSVSTSNTTTINKGQTSNTSRNALAGVNDDSSKKVENQIKEYIEGTVGLLPNSDYRAKTIYGIHGVGEIFSGSYYFKKVRHTIGETYTVEADVIRVEKVIFKEDEEEDRRPPAPPNPTPPPPPSDYEKIERWGTVIANGGLNVRGGDPQSLTVDSSGHVTSGSSKAPVIGALAKGRRVKVGFRKGKWYNVYFGNSGGWCYKQYIRLD